MLELKFDNIHFRSMSGELNRITFQTYLCISSGNCVDSSFSAERFSELDHDLQEMAFQCLDLSDRQAKFCFEFFVHHGETPWVSRTNMKLAFSITFQPNSKGTKVRKMSRFIDDGILECSKNGGCEECGMKKGE
jgi:hypothetical protein